MYWSSTTIVSEQQMKKFSLVFGLIIAATLVPVKAIAASFSQIIVYGDSLSDLGRVSAATGGFQPSYSQGNGRFSNGPVWIEYLADRLGLATNPATNFAVGGARTEGHAFEFLFPSLIGIEKQVANNSFSDPDALYAIWGGANDYFDGQRDASIPLNNLYFEIATLILRGAKNIIVPNLPDLGVLPSKRNTTESSALSAVSQSHNTGLATTLDGLRLLYPGVTLNLLDVNSLFQQALTNPSSYGLSNVTDSCYIDSSTICADPTTYLFWDGVHPTTGVHQLVGNLAFNTVSPTAVPEPITILGSLMAAGSAVAFKRKLKQSNGK
jgi:thermolabile hemolysin